MRRRTGILAAISAVLMCCMVLVGCSGPYQRVGTIPRGTPDRGNGTPAVVPSVVSTAPAAKMAGEQVKGSSYTFVRTNQLQIALKGAKPRQVTNFDFSNLPNVYWDTPRWSEGNRYIAFIMSATTSGVGGGGCPGPEEALGSLYIWDTTSGDFTLVAFPAVQQKYRASGQPRMDYWKYAAWEDATHVLAWYNGDAGSAGKTVAGFYRYDVTTRKTALVIPANALAAQSQEDLQKGMPLLLSVRYSSGKLFYQAVQHPYEKQSQLAIYSRDLKWPDRASTLEVSQGTTAWCSEGSMANTGGFTFPGWDISPNGEQLVTQMTIGSVQSLHRTSHTTTALFSQVPAEVFKHDVQLQWAPDSQNIVCSSNAETYTGRALLSTSLADPSVTVQYAPALSGRVSWRADSAAFALENNQQRTMNSVDRQNVYVFVTGDIQGQTLLADAYKFTWG